MNLGITYKNQGRFEEALRALRDVVALDPKGAEARYNFGNVYALQGRFDEVIVEFREALR